MTNYEIAKKDPSKNIIKHGSVTINSNGKVTIRDFEFLSGSINMAGLDAVNWALECLQKEKALLLDGLAEVGKSK